jgi:hypothetical protein
MAAAPPYIALAWTAQKILLPTVLLLLGDATNSTDHTENITLLLCVQLFYADELFAVL